jgi:hypothetical protein
MPEQADTTTRPSLSHDLPTLAVSVEFNPDNYTLMDDGSELVPIWIIKTNLNGTIEIPEKFSASCTGGEKDRPSQFTMDFILNKMKLRAKFDTLTTNGDLNILHNTPVTGLTTLYGIITVSQALPCYSKYA